MLQLACPECRTSLHRTSEKYFCRRCQSDYIIRNGIACFNETNHYYGELSQTDMQEFLKLAEASGWENAVLTYLSSKNPGLIRTIKDPQRTSWLSLINLKGNETVLDFGCGLGGASVPLAKLVDRVISLDGCYDRIRFLQIRRDQEKLQNILLVCNGKAHKLPFPDAVFDLVVLNMVFPYLASTLPNQNIPTAENIILREITRTLKPGGQLYLSVRNRYSLHRLKSIVFPFGREPSAETFSFHGYGYYQRLLSASGMVNVKSFWPLPNYRYPEHFVPLEGNAEERSRKVNAVKEFSNLKKTITKMASRIGGLKPLAETISFLAQRNTC